MTAIPELSEAALLAPFWRGIGSSFRGEIWDNAASVAMVHGYSNDNKPFDITTAHYLKPVFRAIRDHTKRKVVVRAGVQTLKTFTVEESAWYFAQHDPGDMALYDCDGDAATDHAKTRAIPRLKAIPGIAEMLGEVESRHDLTTSLIKLPAMNLRLWPLNESAVQRITLRYVFICDAFLAKKNGLIRHAIARSTQHSHDKKIIIESQGSDAGDDFDEQCTDTNMQELHIICPTCGMGQPFEWERYRDEKFEAAAPGVSEELRGKYSGMQRGDKETTVLADGSYNESAIQRETFYECYHCGAHIEDTPSNRLKLDETSYYVQTNTNALPEHIGFTWPAWINQRLKWGDLMLEYLKAVRADKELGNRLPLKEWVQKRCAKQWRDDIGVFTARVTDTAYDPASDMPGKVARFGVIDCQEDLTHFWMQIWDVDNRSNVRMVARAHCQSKKEVEDLLNLHKVAVNCIAVDGRHKTGDVIQWAADNRYIGPGVTSSGKKIAQVCFTWLVLFGSDKPAFRWPNGRMRYFDYGHKGIGNRYPVTIQHGGKALVIYVIAHNWSNLGIKDIARRYRDKDNAPKFETLPDSETGPQSFTEQIFSEYRGTKNGKAIWLKRTGKVHNHDWDNFCQLLVLMDKRGMLSFDAPVVEEAEPT